MSDMQPPAAKQPSLDLQTHLAKLEADGLLVRIDHPINKDTELHPVGPLQFLGGIHENDRRAFLFTNVVDPDGRHYDIPVVVGALAASPKIYAIGMGVQWKISAPIGSMPSTIRSRHRGGFPTLPRGRHHGR